MVTLFNLTLEILRYFLIAVVGISFGSYQVAIKALENIPRSETVEIEGFQFAYREYNKEKEKTLVLIHGFAGNSLMWDRVAKNLNYRVIAVDIPPFGFSTKDHNYDYRLENTAENIMILLEKLGVEKFYLGGHSMGGGVSSFIASRYPEKVEKLILIDSVFLENGSHSQNSESTLNFPPIIFDLTLKQYPILTSFYKAQTKQQDKIPKEEIDWFYAQLYFLPSEIFLKFSREFWKDFKGIDYTKISAKTLIIWGKDDNVIPLETAEKLQKKIYLSQLVVIENTGHSPFVELPEEVAKIINGFLN